MEKITVRQRCSSGEKVLSLNSDVPRQSCVRWGPNPTWEGQFWGIGRPLYSIGNFCRELCKIAEPIGLPFELWTRMGRRKHKFNRIRQVAPMCPHEKTHCRHLANTIEPSVYGGDAPCVKLLWPLVFFGHSHLQSRADSRALRAEYCIVGNAHNTAIYFNSIYT